MSYTKTTWVNGSVPGIDATNLNKIEQGIYDAHEGIANLGTAVSSADAKILASIAPSETSPTASAHTTGDCFIYDGQLYTAIADIAQGDTLTVNTNIETTTLVELLSSS